MNEQQQRWRRVGEAITRRYKQDLHIDQAELVRRSGVSDPIIRNMESGKKIGPKGPRETTIYKVEQALRWAEGSIASILAGGEPTELPVEVTQPDEELRVAIQELGATVASLAARHETSAAANDELTRRAEVERLEIDSALARLADRVAALEQRLAE